MPSLEGKREQKYSHLAQGWEATAVPGEMPRLQRGFGMPWNELGDPVTGWDGAGAGWDAPGLTQALTGHTV